MWTDVALNICNESNNIFHLFHVQTYIHLLHLNGRSFLLYGHDEWHFFIYVKVNSVLFMWIHLVQKRKKTVCRSIQKTFYACYFDTISRSVPNDTCKIDSDCFTIFSIQFQKFIFGLWFFPLSHRVNKMTSAEAPTTHRRVRHWLTQSEVFSIFSLLLLALFLSLWYFSVSSKVYRIAIQWHFCVFDANTLRTVFHKNESERARKRLYVKLAKQRLKISHTVFVVACFHLSAFFLIFLLTPNFLYVLLRA